MEVPLQMGLTLWVKGGREVNTASTAEFRLMLSSYEIS